MTKYKEYLRAKGIKLECNYAFLPCGYIEAVATEVTDNCVAAVVYSNCTEAEYVVFNRYGMCGYFNSYGYKAYVKGSQCNPEYIAILLDMDPSLSDFELAVLWHTYQDHAKVRIAFKHMKAGLMDAETFYKLAFRYQFH